MAKPKQTAPIIVNPETVFRFAEAFRVAVEMTVPQMEEINREYDNISDSNTLASPRDPRVSHQIICQKNTK
ncbi:MAG: hypothetical protein ABSC42_07290 [Tepidisphaeraceae bacterium]|jgi:hypothetical protein